MKTISVHSLPFEKILTTVAEELGSELQVNCNVYTVKIPHTYGKGYIRGVNFPDGLGIIYYNLILRSDLTIEFKGEHVHPLKFFYCTEGNVDVRAERSGTLHTLDQFRCALLSTKASDCETLYLRASKRIKLCSLEINRSEFNSYIGCEDYKFNSKLVRLLKNKNRSETIFEKGNYTYQMLKTISSLEQTFDSGICQKFYMASKATQIFVDQVQAYGGAKPNNEFLENLKLARRLEKTISENLGKYSSIKAVADDIHLSYNKLTKAFSEVHGSSLSSYIQEKRMEEILYLLEFSDMTITEIAAVMHIKSPSYLSKIVRKETGKSPSELRENRS